MEVRVEGLVTTILLEFVVWIFIVVETDAVFSIEVIREVPT